MVAGADLALLHLNMDIVEVHIVADRLHVLVPRQLLQGERIPAQHQVADGEGVAEDVRRDTPIREPAVPLQPTDHLLYALPRQRTLAEKGRDRAAYPPIDAPWPRPPRDREEDRRHD